MITAAIKNKNSIALYDINTQQYKGTIYVTTGEIIGQPLVSADRISVTINEQGATWIVTYDHNMQYKNKIRVS